MAQRCEIADVIIPEVVHRQALTDLIETRLRELLHRRGVSTIPAAGGAPAS